MKVTKEMGIILPDTTIDAGEPVFLDTKKAPFHLHGFCEPFLRVPHDVATATSESVLDLSQMSAGCRVRFRTDSDYIVFHADLKEETAPQHSILASCGADLFEFSEGSYHFRGCCYPSQGAGKTYLESRVRLRPGMKDLVMDLPLFAKIQNLYIALREGCELEEGGDYARKKPVVFYGSSIVHGVGTCRPGGNYPAIISRILNTEFINLGFSGAAKAEPAILDYIATLPMSVFVYDYDHNAPSPAYLRETHYAGYRRFRAVQPTTPIIMASKPDYYNPNVEIEDAEERRQIIIASYNRARAEGDENVWFVDGSLMYDPEYREESTADGCHPNDVGYQSMAKAIGAAIVEAFAKIQA